MHLIMKKVLFGFLLLATLFSGCKNDLDIVAPGEEVMVVYGLLNIADSVHYIKVNKGFASEETAPIELAKDTDNLFFDSLQVTLTNLSTGVSRVCEKSAMQKDPGIFNSQVNYIYKTQWNLTAGHTYELKVYNPITGKTAKSAVVLIGNPDINVPGIPTVNQYVIKPGTQFLVSFDGHSQSYVYDMRINLVYEEISNPGGIVTRDTVVWHYTSGKFNDQKRINLRNDGQLFYDFLASTLEVKGPNITRRGLYLDFEYWTGDKELSTYMDVYGTSSIGVVQKKSDYTNIQGGHGLFAGRNFLKITGSTLRQEIKTELKNNPVMTPFRFVD